MNSNKKGLLLNGIFIVFEIVAIILTVMFHNTFEFKYYTEDSNLFALIVAVIYFSYLSKKKKIPKYLSVLRLISTVSLALTFCVVIFFLLPVSNFNFGFMLGGVNFFFHLACPLLMLYMFLFVDKKCKFNIKDVLMVNIPTITYGIILIILNILRKVDGPYPFLQVYKNTVFESIIWFVGLNLFIVLAGCSLIKIKKLQKEEN